jgi:hypothetical protein
VGDGYCQGRRDIAASHYKGSRWTRTGKRPGQDRDLIGLASQDPQPHIRLPFARQTEWDQEI